MVRVGIAVAVAGVMALVLLNMQNISSENSVGATQTAVAHLTATPSPGFR